MTDYLILTGVGSDAPGIVNKLTAALHDMGCSIEESRMSILGGEFAIILLVSADGSAIRKVDSSLDELNRLTGLQYISKKTRQKTSNNTILRYNVEVMSMDQSGIVHSVTEFFAGQSINIESLSSETYAAPHSGTPMFALDLVIEVPADTSVAQLRSSFLDFCDDLLLDASLESA